MQTIETTAIVAIGGFGGYELGLRTSVLREYAKLLWCFDMSF
jgi:hypothetical protein